MRLRVEIETPDRGGPSPREEVMTHEMTRHTQKQKKRVPRPEVRYFLLMTDTKPKHIMELLLFMTKLVLRDFVCNSYAEPVSEVAFIGFLSGRIPVTIKLFLASSVSSPRRRQQKLQLPRLSTAISTNLLQTQNTTERTQSNNSHTLTQTSSKNNA